MVFSWFVLVVGVAVFVSMVLLTVVCLQCRNRGPLASIRQGNVSDEYMHSFSTDPHQKPRSRTPTETESNPSYENPAGSDYVNGESDADEPGYIIVLPDNGAPLPNRSRASTPSSDVLPDYENVPEKKEDRDYLNVDQQHFQRSTPDLSTQSDSDNDDDDNDDDDDDDDDDDEEANYVNIHEGVHTD